MRTNQIQYQKAKKQKMRKDSSVRKLDKKQLIQRRKSEQKIIIAHDINLFNRKKKAEKLTKRLLDNEVENKRLKQLLLLLDEEVQEGRRRSSNNLNSYIELDTSLNHANKTPVQIHQLIEPKVVVKEELQQSLDDTMKTKKQKIKASNKDKKSSSKKIAPKTSYKQMLDMKFRKSVQNKMMKQGQHQKDLEATPPVQPPLNPKKQEQVFPRQKYFDLIKNNPKSLIETNQFNDIQLMVYKSDSLTQSKIDDKFNAKEFDQLKQMEINSQITQAEKSYLKRDASVNKDQDRSSQYINLNQHLSVVKKKESNQSSVKEVAPNNEFHSFKKTNLKGLSINKNLIGLITLQAFMKAVHCEEAREREDKQGEKTDEGDFLETFKEHPQKEFSIKNLNMEEANDVFGNFDEPEE